MALVMTEAEARQRLEREVSASEEPTLGTAEIDDLLELAERQDANARLPLDDTEFVASAVYALDDVVVPTVRTGRSYRVTVAGTAGTEPSWPVSGTITTGSVTFSTEDPSTAWLPTYDLNPSIAKGWMWKAGKAANDYDFGTDADNFSRSQRHQQFLTMAAQYGGGRSGRHGGTIRVRSREGVEVDEL